MTLIKPNKHNSMFSALLILAVFLLTCASLALIISYNRLVQTNQRLASATAALAEIEATNADLKEQLVTLFSGPAIETLVRTKSLVKEKNPIYLKASPELCFTENQHVACLSLADH